MTTHDTPQPSESNPMPQNPSGRLSAFLRILERMETETARFFQLPDPHPPSEPLVRPLQNSEANSIKQQWVIVGSDESGWMLEEIDGHYVGIRLAVFEEPLGCDRIIIEPQATLDSILDENRGRHTPNLISVNNALLVGLCVVQSERGAECQRIRLCVKVENSRVQHFPLGTSNRTFHRYTFEASAPVDQSQSRENHSRNHSRNHFRNHFRNLPIRPWAGDRRVGELTQEWEISQFSLGLSSIALLKLDGRSCDRSLESFDYDSDRRKLTIEFFVEDAGPFHIRGECVDCGEFSLLGRMIGVRPSFNGLRYRGIITIEADVCSVSPSSQYSTVFTVRTSNSQPQQTQERSPQGYFGRIIGNRDIEYTRYHSLDWNGSSGNQNSNRASDKGFTKQDCRFFYGSDYLMCSVQPCGPCDGCKDYEIG